MNVILLYRITMKHIEEFCLIAVGKEREDNGGSFYKNLQSGQT